MATKCSLCYNNYNEEKLHQKIKKQNICLECFIKKEKPYRIALLDFFNNVCGGCDIYKIYIGYTYYCISS